jgi:hypothetical protein
MFQIDPAAGKFKLKSSRTSAAGSQQVAGIGLVKAMVLSLPSHQQVSPENMARMGSIGRREIGAVKTIWAQKKSRGQSKTEICIKSVTTSKEINCFADKIDHNTSD